MSAVTVIVPTALGGPRVARLLESLELERADAQAIVVDNASADPAIAGLASRPQVEVIRQERNVGYSRAINLGARAAEGEAIVLLNDDCWCEPGFLEAISRPLDAGNGRPMVAGVMRDVRNPDLIDSAGVEVDATLLVFDYLNGEPVAALAGGVAPPFGPSGAAAAFDRDAFLALGGFDERIFAYWEDVDLIIRMRLEGARGALATAAIGTHEHSATLGPGSSRKNYLTGFGRGYVLRKWGVVNARRVLPVLARDGTICAGQAVWDRNLAATRGRIRGYLSGPRGRYPAAALAGADAPTLPETLRRRLSRRARLRASIDRGEGLRSLVVLHLAQVSGPARSLRPALELLAALGEARVLTPGGGPLAAELVELGAAEQADYRALTFPRGPVQAARALRRLAGETALFRRELRRHRADIALVATSTVPSALLAARLSRTAAIAYVGEIAGRHPGTGIGREAGARALARMAAALATEVVVPSQAVAAHLGPGVRATVINPPIGERFARGDGPAFRERHGIPSDARLVTAVGAITRGRGQDVLLRAAARLRGSPSEVVVAVVGEPYDRPPDHDFRAALDRLAVELGMTDSLRFCGFESRVEDAYAAADVFVNPARVEEALGRAAFEALSAGCPVVATRVGGTQELLRDGENALLVERDAPEQMAAAIERLLGDAALARRLAAAGRELVRDRLGAERARDQWEAVVERAASRAARAPARAPGLLSRAAGGREAGGREAGGREAV